MKAEEDHKSEMVLQKLMHIYKRKVMPLEKAYKFDVFQTSTLTEGDIKANPMVLLIGQYSVGKTTFIKYLLERDHPGMRIGL